MQLSKGLGGLKHLTTLLKLQAKAIKDYIKRRTKSPPSPTNLALNQLVKGCRIAMNSAVLLAEENRQLRAENQRQKKKRAKKRAYIATGGVLTVEEGLDRSNIEDREPEGGVVNQEAPTQTRAPRTCSMCKSLLHTACTCPTKYISN
jgi:hypothetical protein